MNRSDGICKLCNKLELQRTHIFMKCEIIDEVFDDFNDIYTPLDDRAISQREKAFGIFEEINDKILLRNYTLFTIRHIIYRNRNILLSRGENIKEILVNKIKQFIRKDLIERFNIAKYKNEVQLFKDKYLIGDKFGKVINNELLIFI